MKIILVGEGGSGKNYILKKLIEAGFNYMPSHTTRPMREGETSQDYHFVTPEYFSQLESRGTFIEVNTFNNWKYGHSFQAFENSEVIILDPATALKFKNEAIIIYVTANHTVLLSRLLDRNDSDSLSRLIRDIIAFNGFNGYHIKATSHQLEPLLHGTKQEVWSNLVTEANLSPILI